MYFFFVNSDDTKLLTEFVKTDASAANSTVSSLKERLRNISLKLEGITLTSVRVNIDDMLTDADQACKYLMLENSQRDDTKEDYIHRTPR